MRASNSSKLKKRDRKTGRFFDGGICYILDDLNLVFAGDMLKEILSLYNLGYSVEEIGEYFERDPDEIFLALMHLARQGVKVRKIGRRCMYYEPETKIETEEKT